MNKKILVTSVLLLAVVMLATPLVAAKPGDVKSNDKFEFFQLVTSGEADGNVERSWLTPPTATIAEESKTAHTRGAGWTVGDKVELTVGTVTYTEDSSPVRVDYDTTYDADAIRNPDGSMKFAHVRLTDIVTVYVDDVPIGTIVLQIKATGGPDVGYSGNIVGYGTEALKGVHISAIDTVMPPTFEYTRIGTIQGFPMLPPLV